MDRYGKSENRLMFYELINSLKTEKKCDICLKGKKFRKKIGKWIIFCDIEIN